MVQKIRLKRGPDCTPIDSAEVAEYCHHFRSLAFLGRGYFLGADSQAEPHPRSSSAALIRSIAISISRLPPVRRACSSNSRTSRRAWTSAGTDGGCEAVIGSGYVGNPPETRHSLGFNYKSACFEGL